MSGTSARDGKKFNATRVRAGIVVNKWMTSHQLLHAPCNGDRWEYVVSHAAEKINSVYILAAITVETVRFAVKSTSIKCDSGCCSFNCSRSFDTEII